MRIAIGEAESNHVTWTVRSPLYKLLVGVLVATVFLVALLLPSPTPARWGAIGLVVAGALVVAVILTLTTPLVDEGHLERLPDGGSLERTRTWPLVAPRTVLQLSLDRVAAFEVETSAFEDAPPTTLTLARLQVRDVDGATRLLTEWAEPASVLALGEALAKAGRRELTRLSPVV